MLEPFLATDFPKFVFANFDRIIKQFSTWLNATHKKITENLTIPQAQPRQGGIPWPVGPLSDT